MVRQPPHVLAGANLKPSHEGFLFWNNLNGKRFSVAAPAGDGEAVSLAAKLTDFLRAEGYETILYRFPLTITHKPNWCTHGKPPSRSS